MPELLQSEISSPFQRRAELKALVRRDLPGPTGGLEAYHPLRHL